VLRVVALTGFNPRESDRTSVTPAHDDLVAVPGTRFESRRADGEMRPIAACVLPGEESSGLRQCAPVNSPRPHVGSARTHK
jgi:hypothetical protein